MRKKIKIKHHASPTPRIVSPSHTKSEIVIDLAWEALIKYFHTNNDIELSKQSEISSIIYKLTDANTRGKSLTFKSRELSIKEEYYQIQKAKIQNKLEATDQNNSGSLSPETMRLIEEQLKLL